jgi:hypothetical protein
MDDVHEHERARVIRIARAMCRAKRLDPDQPLDEAIPAVTGAKAFIDSLPSSDVPTWLLFVSEAKRFVAANQDGTSQL